jgi:hypothetical protein
MKVSELGFFKCLVNASAPMHAISILCGIFASGLLFSLELAVLYSIHCSFHLLHGSKLIYLVIAWGLKSNTWILASVALQNLDLPIVGFYSSISALHFPLVCWVRGLPI